MSVLCVRWYRTDSWVEYVFQTMLSHKMIWCDSQAFLHVVVLISCAPHLSQILQWVQIPSCFFYVSNQLLFFDVEPFQQFLRKFWVRLCKRQNGLTKVFWNIFSFVPFRRATLIRLSLLLMLLFALNLIFLIRFVLFFDREVRISGMNLRFLGFDFVSLLNFDQN